MKVNKISQNFMVYYGTLLRLCSTLIYFINFPFCFWCFQKLTTKFRSLLKWFKISKFWTCQRRKLKKSISQMSNHLCRPQPFPQILGVGGFERYLQLKHMINCGLAKFSTTSDGLIQGILTEEEGSVQLTTSLSLFCKKGK
jgi:hypothetical protein